MRFVAPFVAAIPILALRCKLALGVDGLRLTEPGRRLSLSYDDVVSVTVTPVTVGRYKALEIALRSGQTLRFPVPGTEFRSGIGLRRVEAIVERVRQAKESQTVCVGDTAAATSAGTSCAMALTGRTGLPWAVLAAFSVIGVAWRRRARPQRPR